MLLIYASADVLPPVDGSNGCSAACNSSRPLPAWALTLIIAAGKLGRGLPSGLSSCSTNGVYQLKAPLMDAQSVQIVQPAALERRK